jgi:glutathione synthase/RimK-type ligase-like ATP-grasp enzyme
MKVIDIALASFVREPGSTTKEDPDEAPLLAALRARGVRAESLAWDDPAARFDTARVTFLRATWNYHRVPQRFARWIEQVSRQTALYNPAAVVHWNMHKRYLLELASRGVPIVPTELVPQDSDPSLEEICARRGFGAVVIKPAVSAGSRSTQRFTASERVTAEGHLRAVTAREDALVQPYLPEVEGRGERSLVVVDGEITHALRKAPRFAGQAESITPVDDSTAAERALALRAVEAVGAPLFYARVDLVSDAAGPKLMELELIEPSLYFEASAYGLDRFVDGALERLQQTR